MNDYIQRIVYQLELRVGIGKKIRVLFFFAWIFLMINKISRAYLNARIIYFRQTVNAATPDHLFY